MKKIIDSRTCKKDNNWKEEKRNLCDECENCMHNFCSLTNCVETCSHALNILRITEENRKEQDSFINNLIRIKELEEMYEMFKKKIWARHEDVCGDEMIELNSAEEVLFNLLSELGCWNEEKIYKEGNN